MMIWCAVVLAAGGAWLLASPDPSRRRLRGMALFDGAAPAEARGGPLLGARSMLSELAQQRELLALPVAAGCASGALVGSVTLTGWLPVLGSVLCGGTVGGWVAKRREATRGRDEQRRNRIRLPLTLELLAGGLTAGTPLRLAVSEVSRVCDPSTGDVLRQLTASVEVGVSDEVAWRSLVADPVWGDVARDVSRGVANGSALADLLRRHAAEARDVCQQEALFSARQVGVAAVVPLMVCFLPAFLLTGVVPIIGGLLADLLR